MAYEALCRAYSNIVINVRGALELGIGSYEDIYLLQSFGNGIILLHELSKLV